MYQVTGHLYHLQWQWATIKKIENASKEKKRVTLSFSLSRVKIGYYSICRSISRTYQLNGDVCVCVCVWGGKSTQSEHPQLHPGEKPLEGLCYFDTFEMCSTWIFTPIAAFIVISRQVTWISASEGHVKRGIPRVRRRFSSLHYWLWTFISMLWWLTSTKVCKLLKTRLKIFLLVCSVFIIQ